MGRKRFFVPEDLALVEWQEDFGSDDEFVVPYVQVPQNLREVNLEK